MSTVYKRYRPQTTITEESKENLIYKNSGQTINTIYWQGLLELKLSKRQNNGDLLLGFQVDYETPSRYESDGLRIYITIPNESGRLSAESLERLLPGSIFKHGEERGIHIKKSLDTFGVKTWIVITSQMQQGLNKKNANAEWWRENKTMVETFLIIVLIIISFACFIMLHRHVEDYQDPWQNFKRPIRLVLNLISVP